MNIFLNRSLLIPLNKPEFNLISNKEFQEKEYYAYGLYHCIIKKDNLKVINNLLDIILNSPCCIGINNELIKMLGYILTMSNS